MINIPNLGVGIGFRKSFLGELFFHQEKVDFLEIIADHYLDSLPEKDQELDLLANHFTLVPHGLNLSLGSGGGIDEDYLQKLAKLIKKINPPWWSEHLSFTQAGGIDIGHLSPLPYTEEAINVVCRNIETVRRYIDVPLILENITYMVTIPGAEMTEAQFIAEIAERANCGLLLDVTNFYTNSTNHNYDIELFFRQLPLERIVQLHFVGGYYHNGILIDSHSHPTPFEVWQLMERVIKQTSVKGIVLERDENIPPFKDLVRELEQARNLRRK